MNYNQSFIYTLLNDQTILFQTIQFFLSHSFSQFKTSRSYQMPPHLGREYPVAIAVKRYATFLKPLALL